MQVEDIKAALADNRSERRMVLKKLRKYHYDGQHWDEAASLLATDKRLWTEYQKLAGMLKSISRGQGYNRVLSDYPLTIMYNRKKVVIYTCCGRTKIKDIILV